jgi:ubiquinone/menaquinone biosynthesis C-methylase UbiE
MIWFQKDCPHAVFMDRREVDNQTIWTGKDKTRTLTVKPDVVADFTDMPFKDGSFHLVVFDPPHLDHVGKNSWLAAKYGVLDVTWPVMIRDGFRECMRVLKPYGTLVFKWSEYQIPSEKIWKAIGQKPLFGTRCGKNAKTIWAVFMKFEEEECSTKQEDSSSTKI